MASNLNSSTDGQSKVFKTINVKGLAQRRPSIGLKTDIQPTIVPQDHLIKTMAGRNTNSKKIVVPVTKLQSRDQIWSRQSRLRNRPQTTSQFQAMRNNKSKESLTDLNEMSPPKKVQGTGDE